MDKQAHSENQITLLALLNDEIAGLVNITADQRKRVRHIGRSLYCDWSEVLE